jgi:hypothetical protein
VILAQQGVSGNGSEAGVGVVGVTATLPRGVTPAVVWLAVATTIAVVFAPTVAVRASLCLTLVVVRRVRRAEVLLDLRDTTLVVVRGAGLITGFRRRLCAANMHNAVRLVEVELRHRLVAYHKLRLEIPCRSA